MERDNEIFRRIKNADPKWADEILNQDSQMQYVQRLEEQRKIKQMAAVFLREMPFLTIICK
jgi:hypothetical protein